MIDCDCLNQNYLCIKTSPVQHNVLNHQFLRPAFSKKGYSSFDFINNFSLFLNICLLLISRQICFSNQLEFSNVSFIITAWFFLKLFIFQGPKLQQSMKTLTLCHQFTRDDKWDSLKNWNIPRKNSNDSFFFNISLFFVCSANFV